MKGTNLLLAIGRLSYRHQLYSQSLQQRLLLHTCLPLMNQEKPEKFDEQPHMRISAKAAAKDKGMDLEENTDRSMRFFSRSSQLYDVS